MKLVQAQYEISFNELSKAGILCYCQDSGTHDASDKRKSKREKVEKKVIFIHQS